MPILGVREISPTKEYYAQAEAFASRWNEREESRQINIDSIKDAKKNKSILSIDTAERVSKRLKRLANNPVAQLIANESFRANPLGEDFRKIAEERLLGKDDIVDITYLMLGLMRAKSVCRLDIGQGHAFGTGFLVSPFLLMTNNHVIPDEVTARQTQAQFNYENTLERIIQTPDVFILDPDAFFHTSEDLDFTLVAVKGEESKLRSYGWNKLIGDEGKAVLGENVSIIQHPGSQPKKVAIRDNELIDILPNFLHYRTDTNPGASGAPVFNDQWEVVALHHLGVPRKNKEGHALKTDGKTWDRFSDDGDDIDWIANEGTRVSSIVKNVRERFPDGTNMYVDQMLKEPVIMPRNVLVNERPNSKVDPIVIDHEVSAQTGSGLSISIPININVNLGGTSVADTTSKSKIQTQVSQDRSGGIVTLTPKEVLEYEKLEIDPSWEDREGYNPTFLGQSVPLPTLSPDQLTKVAYLSDRFQKGGKKSYELKYHHYSVVMNGERRIAYFSAGNIDGENWYKVVRRKASGGGKESWYFDPRIDKEEQAGDFLYAGNDLDRGHLIRREYMTWGNSEEALAANNDTFHWCNCSPQHKDLNQSGEQWLGLENYVLMNAKEHQMRVSAFAGPVFQERDPVYRGIKIPRAFWKVVVMAKENGSLSATGYLLHQDMLVRQVLAEEEFVYGDFQTFQVPISYLEAQTKLNFGKLRNFDPMKNRNFQEFFSESFGIPGRPYTSFDQLVL